MPISLPSSPTNGQQVTTGGKTYQWNGRFWRVVSSGTSGGGGAASWGDITGKPTEFTPAAHTQAISSISGLQTALDAKQAALVSGENIKTINGQSILGSGDLAVSGSGGGSPILPWMI